MTRSNNMRVSLLLLAFLLLPAVCWGQGVTPGSAIGQIAANPPLASVAGNTQIVFADRRAPGSGDDITRNVQPGSAWISGGSPGQVFRALSTGLGQATWALEPVPPLPLDEIGLYVSAASYVSGASGYVANEVLTFAGGVKITINTVTGGAPATWTVTTPQMYACATTGNQSQTSTTGSGTGALWTFTVNFPTFYGRIRGSRCYTAAGRNAGALAVVTNSVTSQTLAVPFLAGTNGWDAQAAIAFADGALNPVEYNAYNSGPAPAITTLYDTGGTTDYAGSNTTDATAALSTACYLYSGRVSGNGPNAAPTMTCPANAGSGTPSSSFMTIPSAVSINGANATMEFAGTVGPGGYSFGYLGPSAGTNYYGITQQAVAANLWNINAGDTGSSNLYFSTNISSTPGVFGFSSTSGKPILDSSFQPATASSFFAFVSGGTVSAGVTATLTVYGGTTGTTVSNPITVTYTATAADAAAINPYVAYMDGLIAAVNSNAALAAAGLTCAHTQPVSIAGAQFTCFIPVGPATPTAWNIAASGSGGGMTFSNQTSIINGSTFGTAVSGGKISGTPFSSNTGNSTHDAILIANYPISVAKQHALRRSLEYWLGYTEQYSVRIVVEGASNTMGLQSAWGKGQAYPDFLPSLLNRADVAVFNTSAAGTQMAANAGSFASGIIASGQPGNPGGTPLYWGSSTALNTQLKGKLSSGNLILVAGTYNDFATASYTASLASTGVLTITGTSGMAPVKGMVITGAGGVSATITATALDGGTPCNGAACTGYAGSGTFMTSQTGLTVGSEVMTSVGTPAALLNSHLALAAAAAALRSPGAVVGDTVICSPEPTKKAGSYSGGGTNAAQMQAFGALLVASGCGINGIVVNPLTFAALNTAGDASANYPAPWYEQLDNGTHTGWFANFGLVAKQAAETIRQVVQ